MRRWGRFRDVASKIDLKTLRSVRSKARKERRLLDQVLFIADERLTLPLIGSNAIVMPLHADWGYRPDIWKGPIAPFGRAAVPPNTRFGDEMTIHHDCKVSELTIRQIRNTKEDDLAPFGFRMDVFNFDGTFLSLAVALPKDAINKLQRRHVLRLETHLEFEKPVEIFARLNIGHGPNVEQMVRELDRGKSHAVVEFDLAYSEINEKRVEKAWVDLIFDDPSMNQIIIRDLTFYRRPRAEI